MDVHLNPALVRTDLRHFFRDTPLLWTVSFLGLATHQGPKGLGVPLDCGLENVGLQGGEGGLSI